MIGINELDQQIWAEIHKYESGRKAAASLEHVSEQQVALIAIEYLDVAMSPHLISSHLISS
jgi:hypothetical protein